MVRIEADLRHLAELADRHDLNFDFEQYGCRKATRSPPCCSGWIMRA